MRTIPILTLLALALTVVALATPPALAESTAGPDLRLEIQKALKQPSSVTHTDWWRSLGPTAPEILRTMYGETKSAFERGKIIEALANYPDPDSATFVKAKVSDSSNKTIRYIAIRSLGKMQGPPAAEFLSPILADSDPHARLEAAEALRRMKDPHAEKLLQEYLPREKDAWVLGHLKKTMAEPSSRVHIQRPPVTQ